LAGGILYGVWSLQIEIQDKGLLLMAIGGVLMAIDVPAKWLVRKLARKPFPHER